MPIFNQRIINARVATRDKNVIKFDYDEKMLSRRAIRIINDTEILESDSNILTINYNDVRCSLGIKGNNGFIYPLKALKLRKEVTFYVDYGDECYHADECPIIPMNTLSTEKLDDFELISSLTSNKDYSLCFSYSGPDHKSNYPVLINLSSTPTNEIIKGNLEDSLKKWNIKFEVRKNYIELLKPDNNIPTIPSEIVNSSERYNKENFTHEYKETYLIEYLFLAINHCCNFLVPSWYGFVFLEMTRIIITYFELKNQGNPFRYQYIFEQLISEKYPNLKSSKQGVLKDLVALEKIGLVKKIEPAVYQSVKRGLTESEKLTISFLKEYYSKFTNINK